MYLALPFSLCSHSHSLPLDSSEPRSSSLRHSSNHQDIEVTKQIEEEIGKARKDGGLEQNEAATEEGELLPRREKEITMRESRYWGGKLDIHKSLRRARENRDCERDASRRYASLPFFLYSHFRLPIPAHSQSTTSSKSTGAPESPRPLTPRQVALFSLFFPFLFLLSSTPLLLTQDE